MDSKQLAIFKEEKLLSEVTFVKRAKHMLRWVQSKCPQIMSYKVWAPAIILLAIMFRVTLTALGWPLLDSDEGTMGLMGMHIAFLGERPIFFYAQGYMGVSEAYLAALMFHFFGVSSFTLRLGVILIYTIFLGAMYLLTSLLYTKKLALFVLVLLAFGSNALLTRELVAVGGDPETLMCGAIIMLLTTWLALTSWPDEVRRNQKWRLVAYAGWGLTAGFALYSHMLGVPLILLGGLLLLLFCWRELLSLAPLVLLVTLLFAAYPIISYNLSAPPNRTTMFYVLHAMDAGNAPFNLVRQIRGALLTALPIATGANPLCPYQDVHALRLGSVYALRCTLVHTGWSLGVIALWAGAVLLAGGMLWRLRPIFPKRQWSAEQRRNFIRHSIGLSLLFSSAATLMLYVMSPNSALYPVATSRYLVTILIATPSLLWPLWYGAYMVKPLVFKFASTLTVTLRFVQLGSRVILICIGGVFLFGTLSTFAGIPRGPIVHENSYFTQNSTQYLDVPITQVLNRQESLLINSLLRMRVRHIYSDYWTCDRLIFQSQERIICSVVGDTLRPGHNRYLPYQSIVRADPNAAYVFQIASLPDKLLAQRIASTKSSAWLYHRMVLYGYAVYRKSIPS